MELTATSAQWRCFPDRQGTERRERAQADDRPKVIHLPSEGRKKASGASCRRGVAVQDNLAERVFVRTVDDVLRIRDKLAKEKLAVNADRHHARQGTGRTRRQALCPLPPGRTSDAETVYLVCTSPGKSASNISADHLVCDLSHVRQHGPAVRPGEPLRRPRRTRAIRRRLSQGQFEKRT